MIGKAFGKAFVLAFGVLLVINYGLTAADYALGGKTVWAAVWVIIAVAAAAVLVWASIVLGEDEQT